MAARILIIEDNPTNLDLMTYLLAAFGHTSLTAQDGEEGIEVVQREQPDLIICDVQLPRMDGYEVARWLKSHPSLRAIPLIAVTALAMVGDRDKLLAAGFNGYLAKPISPENFVAEVEEFLRVPSYAPTLSAVHSTIQPSRLPSRNVTLLVVDNQPINLALARSIFEPFGYQVLSATHGEEALAIALKAVPDLILSDIQMEDGSGYDFIRIVKAYTRLKDIPFVFITSTFLNANNQALSLSLGAAKVLTRPIEPRTLLAEIEACLPQGKKR